MRNKRSKRNSTNNSKFISNTLIIIGTICIVFSVYKIFEWRIIQADMLEENVVIVRNVNDTTGSHIDRDQELTSLQQEVDEMRQDNLPVQQQIDRSEYTGGMLKLNIPKIDVEAGVVNGTTRDILKGGPGLYEISPLPSRKDANVLIAGHRTTYGAWFRHVDKLVEGDEITLNTDKLRYIYKVEKVFIVESNDWSVTESTGYAALTLTSCHPLGSDRQRIIVRAKLEKVINLM